MSIIISQRSAAVTVPLVGVVEDLVGEAPGAWGGAVAHRGVSYRQRTTSGSVYRYAYSVDPESSFSGSRPADAIVDTDGVLTRNIGIDQSVEALFSNTTGTTVRRLNFNTLGAGVLETEVLGAVPDSYLEFSSAIVDALLTSGGSTAVYDTSGNRNMASWWPHSAMTGVPFTTSQSPTSGRFCGPAITKRHLLTANHFAPSIGTIVTWKTASNIAVTSTVIGGAACGWSDLRVVVLDSDLPDSITPFAIPGPWFGAATGNLLCMQHCGIFQNQSRVAGYAHAAQLSDGAVLETAPIAWSGLNSSDFRPAEQLISTVFESVMLPDFVAYSNDFQHFGITGDSGLGWFIPISSGAWAVAGAFQSPFGSPRLYEAVVNACITAADTAAGVSTGYTVTVAPDPTA
jgi:hypothetical protein